MYDPNTDVDYNSEEEVMSKGRLVKARMADQPAPNVSWYWIHVGNCHACKFYDRKTPKCANKKITPAQFFDEYMLTNTCPQFAAGVHNKDMQQLSDVMIAAGVEKGTPSQKVVIIVNEPYSRMLSIRAHREQSIFLNMARDADHGSNDPSRGESYDMSDDLERTSNNLFP